SEVALNNLAQELMRTAQYAPAESLLLRGIELGHGGPLYQNAVSDLYLQGRASDARAMLERYGRDRPRDPIVTDTRASLAAAEHDYVTATRLWRELGAAHRQSPAWQEFVNNALAQAAVTQGKLTQGEASGREAIVAAEARGAPGNAIGDAVSLGLVDLWYRNRPADALKTVNDALARHPLAAMQPLDRPYGSLAAFFAAAGRVDEARRLTAEWERVIPEGVRR